MTVFVLGVAGQLIHLSVVLVADHFVDSAVLTNFTITSRVGERVHMALGLVGVVVHGTGEVGVGWADSLVGLVGAGATLLPVVVLVVAVEHHLTVCHQLMHVVSGIGCCQGYLLTLRLLSDRHGQTNLLALLLALGGDGVRPGGRLLVSWRSKSQGQVVAEVVDRLGISDILFLNLRSTTHLLSGTNGELMLLGTADNCGSSSGVSSLPLLVVGVGLAGIIVTDALFVGCHGSLLIVMVAHVVHRRLAATGWVL